MSASLIDYDIDCSASGKQIAEDNNAILSLRKGDSIFLYDHKTMEIAECVITKPAYEHNGYYWIKFINSEMRNERIWKVGSAFCGNTRDYDFSENTYDYICTNSNTLYRFILDTYDSEIRYHQSQLAHIIEQKALFKNANKDKM